MVDWTKFQIEQYITFLTDKGIKKISYKTTDEDNYTNISHICLDLVLSINRNYYNFVVPRVKLFQDNYPHVKNLDTLIILIEEVGIKNFHKVWNYNHIARIEILYQVCNTLKKICTNNSSYDGDNEIELLRQIKCHFD